MLVLLGAQQISTANTALRIFRIYVHWVQEQRWENWAPQTISEYFEPDVFEAYFVRYNGVKENGQPFSFGTLRKEAGCLKSILEAALKEAGFSKRDALEWYNHVGDQLLEVQEFLDPVLARKRCKAAAAMRPWSEADGGFIAVATDERLPTAKDVLDSLRKLEEQAVTAEKALQKVIDDPRATPAQVQSGEH